MIDRGMILRFAIATAAIILSAHHANGAAPVALFVSPVANGELVEARLDAAALDALHGADSLAVRDFPIGPLERADLQLQRFEPLAPDAVARLGFDEQPIDRSKLPRYFRAKLADGIVMIADRGATIDGFIKRRGSLRFIRAAGGDKPGVYTIEPAAATSAKTGATRRCYNTSETRAPAPAAAQAAGSSGMAAGAIIPPLTAYVTLDVSAMVNNALGGFYPVLSYMLDMIAAHSAQLQDEIPMSLLLQTLQVWTDATMPYNPAEEDYGVTLDAFVAYWERYNPLVPRDVTMLIWGADNTGGLSYVESACVPRFNYGMSDIFIGQPYQYGAFGHELGHTIGAPHSHCLNPPEDVCGNDYGACTRVCNGGARNGLACEEDPTDCPGGVCNAQFTCLGSLVDGTPCTDFNQCPVCHLQPLQDITGPPGGTLMSYCSYLRFEYGSRISTEIRDYVSSTTAACLRPTTTVTMSIGTDTHGFSGAPSTPQGGLPYIQMGRHRGTAKGSTSPALSHAYIAANLHSILPSNALPVRAILRGRIESIVIETGLANPTLSVHRTGFFDEATLTFANAPSLIAGDEVTPWYPDGTGIAAVNLTVLVQDCWYNQGGDCYWGFREVNEVDNTTSYITFASSEHTDPAFRPTLEIEYAE